MSLHNEYVVDSDRPGGTSSLKGEGWIIPVTNEFFSDVPQGSWPAEYEPGKFVTPEADEFLIYGIPRYKDQHEALCRSIEAAGETWSADLEYWLLDSLPAADPGLVLADYLAHGRRLREGTISDSGAGEDLDASSFATHWRYLLVRLVDETGLFVEGQEPAPDVWYALTCRVLSWNVVENERHPLDHDLNIGYTE